MYEILTEKLDVVAKVADLRHRYPPHRLAAAVDELGELGHPDPSLLDLREQSHPVHGLDGVTADVDGCAGDPEVAGRLDDGDVVAEGAEGECAGEPGDTGSRDEDFQCALQISLRSGSIGSADQTPNPRRSDVPA
ncbi:hypothetical protein TUM20985_15240 [Mycobacterium antarcticum]|nr:hypothetical protein TUM20985_15240 [Mycolicibacterium sp. TUM20985]GLP74327.1 hypothetical protein TUM20983_14370 [Mycolicibacterium sp. TUM20983]GLP80124.1 hypothetical protein TUM20984_15440 [Mycolicibacterium sp. TUM20984]